MDLSLILILLVPILILVLLIYIFSVRAKLVNLQENVNKNKSVVSLAKNRLNQVLELVKKTNEEVNRQYKLDDSYYKSVVGQVTEYKNLEISSSTVSTLVLNLENAQKELVKSINVYNKYIRKILIIPVAFLLRFKTEKYLTNE